MFYKYLILFLLLVWLVIVSLQSFHIIKFGTVLIPKSWVVYIFLLGLSFVVMDYTGLINKSLSNFVLTFILVYNVAFNLVFAFDLYRLSPLVNRAEHFFGSILVSFVVYSFLSVRPFYNRIPDQSTKMMFLFFLVITLGALNEVAELFMDIFFKAKNIGPDLFDTNWDILTNFIGAGVFLVITRILNFI